MQTYHPEVPLSVLPSSQDGQPAQEKSRIRGKALARSLSSGMCRPERTPATQKHREYTPEESVFPLQNTAPFLKSPETSQKHSQQPHGADQAEPLTAGRGYQSSCTTYFSHLQIPSLGKKRILSSISSSVHCQKRHKKHMQCA